MKRLKVSLGGKFQKEAICERCKRRYVDRSPIVSLKIKLTSCFTFDFSGILYCILYEDIKYTVFLLCFDVSSLLLFSWYKNVCIDGKQIQPTVAGENIKGVDPLSHEV